MSFTIEKDIPVRKERERRHREPLYPYGKMEIGDSFFVPGDFRTKKKTSLFHRIASSSRIYGKRYGKKFSFKNEKGGIRCWRVE